MTRCRSLLVAACGAWLALWLCAACAPGSEVQLSSEEFKKLDTFEAHALSKADQVFGRKDYRRAAAEYDSFVLEFPRSKAVAYALLRKARSLQLDDKRFEAIKEYNEILDYFPNTVKYAAAALYYIGLCHWENADENKAIATWARMAEDVDYSKHVLAAPAINHLADTLVKQGKPTKAIPYYEQVAVSFRRSNPGAAGHAIGAVVPYYIRTSSNEPKLREFYEKIGGFGRPRRISGELATNRPYWEAVRENVNRHGAFEKTQGELKERFYRYWAATLDGKFPDWDDLQIDLARYKLEVERDTTKWMGRLDDQFGKYQKDGDNARIVKWMHLYRDHKSKVMDYYKKLGFAKMSNAEIAGVMLFFFDQMRDKTVAEEVYTRLRLNKMPSQQLVGLIATLWERHNKLARHVFAKLPLGEMPDPELVQLARFFWGKDDGLVKDLCMTMKDKDLGQAELLRYYHWAKDAKRGVPQADKVASMPKYAKEAVWKKAELLEWSNELTKAITAYQLADNPPENVWRIVGCHVKLKNTAKAVGLLLEIEAFFKDQAPKAAMRIAQIYRGAGMQKQYIASLRRIMKKYPETSQSSHAHQELERLGIKMGGGIDAE